MTQVILSKSSHVISQRVKRLRDCLIISCSRKHFVVCTTVRPRYQAISISANFVSKLFSIVPKILNECYCLAF